MRGADGEAHTRTVRRPLLLRDLDDITAFRWCASKTGVNGTRRCRFDLNNLLLAIERLRAQVSCKNEREGEDVSHAFLGRQLRRPRLARLQNRRADVKERGSTGLLRDDEVVLWLS
jgi:hypothetical protein